MYLNICKLCVLVYSLLLFNISGYCVGPHYQPQQFIDIQNEDDAEKFLDSIKTSAFNNTSSYQERMFGENLQLRLQNHTISNTHEQSIFLWLAKKAEKMTSNLDENSDQTKVIDFLRAIMSTCYVKLAAVEDPTAIEFIHPYRKIRVLVSGKIFQNKSVQELAIKIMVQELQQPIWYS